MDPMNDLERDLIAALRVEPSIELAPKVRARIAAAAAPSRWRVPRLALACGCATLAALGASLVLQDPIRTIDAAVLSHHDVAVVVPLPSAALSVSSRSVPEAAGETMNDVLVSRSEMLALQRLFSGEIVAPPAGDVPDEVVIPMIAVDAITVPAILEGDRQ